MSKVFLFSNNQKDYVLRTYVLRDPSLADTQPESLTGGQIVIGLHSFKIENVVATDQSFSQSFWMEIEWNDERVTWPKLLLRSYKNDELENVFLHVDEKKIWLPDIRLENIKESLGDSQGRNSTITDVKTESSRNFKLYRVSITFLSCILLVYQIFQQVQLESLFIRKCVFFSNFLNFLELSGFILTIQVDFGITL